MQLMIGGQELVQMHVRGWKSYLSEVWNWFDTLGTVFQIAYFTIRCIYPVYSIPYHETQGVFKGTKVLKGIDINWYIPILNTMLMLFSTSKILSNLRAYSTFGIIV